MVVAIEQASRLDGTVAGDHHAEFHAPWGRGAEFFGEHLAWRKQHHCRVQFGILRRASKWLPQPVPTCARSSAVLVGQPPKGIQQHHLADTLRHAQAQHAAWCGVTGHQFTQAIHLAQHPPALFVDPQSAGGGFERLGIAVQQCHSEDSSRLCTRRVIADWVRPRLSAAWLRKRCGSTATKASMSSIFMGPAPIAFLAY